MRSIGVLKVKYRNPGYTWVSIFFAIAFLLTINLKWINSIQISKSSTITQEQMPIPLSDEDSSQSADTEESEDESDDTDHKITPPSFFILSSFNTMVIHWPGYSNRYADVHHELDSPPPRS